MEKFPVYLSTEYVNFFPKMIKKLGVMNIRKEVHDQLLYDGPKCRVELMEIKQSFFKNQDEYIDVLNEIGGELKLMGWHLDIFGGGEIVYIDYDSSDVHFENIK